MLRRVALVRTDVSEEPGASFIRVTKIGERGTTEAATSNRRTLRRNTKYLVYQEPHGVTSQKTPFFIVTAVKTSNFKGLVTYHIRIFKFDMDSAASYTDCQKESKKKERNSEDYVSRLAHVIRSKGG
jgi:hypothetical protein